MHDFVLLVCFDVRTFDVVKSVLAPEEDAEAYNKRLVKKVAAEISCNCNGFHADGDLGLLKMLCLRFPGVAIQVCSRAQSLQLAGCKIPKHYNWIKLLRTTLPPHQPVSLPVPKIDIRACYQVLSPLNY